LLRGVGESRQRIAHLRPLPFAIGSLHPEQKQPRDLIRRFVQELLELAAGLRVDPEQVLDLGLELGPVLRAGGGAVS
jgi:hypothetical protein